MWVPEKENNTQILLLEESKNTQKVLLVVTGT